MTSIADELAEAERAAAGPRQQVAALQAALHQAISAGDFAKAASVKEELAPVREAQALTDARVTALRGAAAQIERDNQAEYRKLAEAEARAEADRAVLAAQGAAAESTARMDGELQEMRESLAEARRHLEAARAHQSAVTEARWQEIQAKGRRGDWPASHPGPAVAAANRVSTLIQNDPLIKVLGQGLV